MQFLVLTKIFLIALGKPVFIVIKWLVGLRWRYFLTWVIIAGLIAGFVWGYENFLKDLPNVNEIYNPPKLSTKILDRNGNLLFKFYEDEDRSWTPISKIPQSLIQATIAIEDKNFYHHRGISIKGLTQASIYNIWKKGSQDGLRGGSTITQQLIKSVFLSNEKTLQRKLREGILAVIIETKLSKDEILERYFNQVAYGGETYGVQEAARKYFGKNVWEISPAEAAFLAGLPAAPSSYSPYGRNPEYGFLRQKHVIEEMVNAGFIDETEADLLKKEKLVIMPKKNDILAPHFVFFVKDYLQKQFGYGNFERRGLIVRTTLDLKTQKIAEKVVAEEIKAVARMRISNGGVLVMDPRSGEILAMVGSKDYDAKDIDGKFNVTTALRQPGSAIKPINYLLALMKGWTLASTVDDTAVSYKIAGQSKPYTPQNYNGKYLGRVTLRTALASSLNIPSVKILAQDGTNNMIDLAEDMGITTWDQRNRFGLALALGSGEVKMTELAGAYSIFATLGKKTELSPILEISNYLGESIYKYQVTHENIVDPRLAYLINNVLSDNQARTPIFGANSKLKIDGHTVAVKTGTTNNLKDNWCIGWTPDVLVASWVGNNDSTPMSWVASGVSGATPIWNRIMKEMLLNKPDEPWEMPPGIYKVKVCGKEELFVDGSDKNLKCPSPGAPTLGG